MKVPGLIQTRLQLPGSLLRISKQNECESDEKEEKVRKTNLMIIRALA